jgi:hypothetical protein
MAEAKESGSQAKGKVKAIKAAKAARSLVDLIGLKDKAWAVFYSYH